VLDGDGTAVAGSLAEAAVMDAVLSRSFVGPVRSVVGPFAQAGGTTCFGSRRQIAKLDARHGAGQDAGSTRPGQDGAAARVWLFLR
jgi:hypothetical protein